MESSVTQVGTFKNKKDQNSWFKRWHGRLTVFVLLSAFFLVRKRKLLKRVLDAVFRLIRRLAKLLG